MGRGRVAVCAAFSKVPEVTAFFWIVKALTTAMGESTSDFLVHTLVPEVAVFLGGIAFAVALYVQFGKDVVPAAVFGLWCVSEGTASSSPPRSPVSSTT